MKKKQVAAKQTSDLWTTYLSWLSPFSMQRIYSRGPKKVNISFPCNEEFCFVSVSFPFYHDDVYTLYMDVHMFLVFCVG